VQSGRPAVARRDVTGWRWPRDVRFGPRRRVVVRAAAELSPRSDLRLRPFSRLCAGAALATYAEAYERKRWDRDPRSHERYETRLGRARCNLQFMGSVAADTSRRLAILQEYSGNFFWSSHLSITHASTVVLIPASDMMLPRLPRRRLDEARLDPACCRYFTVQWCRASEGCLRGQHQDRNILR